MPWQQIAFCVTHPEGHHHEHHDNGKPSLCDLRKSVKADSLWPPMECFEIDIQTDEYLGRTEVIVPDATFIFLYAFVSSYLSKDIFLSEKERCSHPPDKTLRLPSFLTASFSHRGPPLA